MTLIRKIYAMRAWCIVCIIAAAFFCLIWNIYSSNHLSTSYVQKKHIDVYVRRSAADPSIRYYVYEQESDETRSYTKRKSMRNIGLVVSFVGNLQSKFRVPTIVGLRTLIYEADTNLFYVGYAFKDDSGTTENEWQSRADVPYTIRRDVKKVLVHEGNPFYRLINWDSAHEVSYLVDKKTAYQAALSFMISLIALAFVYQMVRMFVRMRIAKVRRSLGVCVECGYSKQIGSVCPECGRG